MSLVVISDVPLVFHLSRLCQTSKPSTTKQEFLFLYKSIMDAMNFKCYLSFISYLMQDLNLTFYFITSTQKLWLFWATISVLFLEFLYIYSYVFVNIVREKLLWCCCFFNLIGSPPILQQSRFKGDWNEWQSLCYS